MSQEIRNTIEWLMLLRETIRQGDTQLAIESLDGAIAIAQRTLASEPGGSVVQFPKSTMVSLAAVGEE